MEDNYYLKQFFFLLYKVDKREHITKHRQYLCIKGKIKSCGKEHALCDHEIIEIEKELKETE